MAVRVTSTCLPGAPPGRGFADWGWLTPAEMIARYRERARAEYDAALAVLAASDADFRVETYRGVMLHRDVLVLQEGRKSS